MTDDQRQGEEAMCTAPRPQVREIAEHFGVAYEQILEDLRCSEGQPCFGVEYTTTGVPGPVLQAVLRVLGGPDHDLAGELDDKL